MVWCTLVLGTSTNWWLPLSGHRYCAWSTRETQLDPFSPLSTSHTSPVANGVLLEETMIFSDFFHFLADAEVISIDAFVKKPNGVIIGVTLVKVCTVYIIVN